MAAPMREGHPPGGGRPAHPANFDDDNEWDIGISDLIIDLDADIEKTDEAGGMAARPEPDAQRTALKMKIKRTKPGTKSSEAKHEIVKSNEVNGEQKPAATAPAAPTGATVPPTPSPAAKRGSSGHRRDKARDKHHHPPPPHDVNGVTRPPAPANTPGPPPPDPPAVTAVTTAVAAVTTVTAAVTSVINTTTAPVLPPSAKKIKTEPKETAEVCVGTSVGTITEPDCLGPCEPGTSVTLEGIVWHETEGGVLVVNVTWRGKTYVGTLLDCTRHDWAPPRFCDSPTEELDARTPKGRGAKRGRGAASNDLTNFTETRSSVHSKLRNGGAKGRRALPSPTPFTPPRPDSKRKRGSETEDRPPTPKAKKPPPPTSSPPPDPVLLECPEPNCSKKYKHANGLKYHRSHAHGSPDDDDKEGSSSEQEETGGSPASPAPPSAPPTPAKSPPPKSPDVKSDKSPEKSPEKAPVESPPPQEEETPPAVPSTPPPPTPPAAPTPPPEALNLQPTQFKVKPRSALMPCEERKPSESPPAESPAKRRRRSPTPGVRSPAYSDISDDAAPTDAHSETDADHRPFSVYHQYYGQGGYLGPPHPAAPEGTKKDDLVPTDASAEVKEVKPEPGPPKVLPQHFYPYNYVQNFPYNVEAPSAPLPQGPNMEEKKEPDRPPSPLDKSKPRPEKDQPRPNENHQILKESIEIKNQMGPYGYQRPPHGREDEMRRYLSGGPDKRVVRPPRPPEHEAPGGKVTVKQEGQKPTTETQGPPPPPTSQYYLPPYMQGGYGFGGSLGGSLGGLLVGWGGRYPGPPPEDLSRPLHYPHHPHHHPHKIHELQEHAKSPGSKPASRAEGASEGGGRSPPPQRHVHTHHHTHVGLGYPLYPPPYPAAAVLASTQAVVNSFPTPPK